MTRDYEWQIFSNPAHVPPLVREVLGILLGRFEKLTQEEHNDIKLILNELIFNAVLHGNKSDESKSVRVGLTAGDGMIRVSITDEGLGFNAEDVLRRHAGADFLKMENGRGIALAKALADEVDYSDGGRSVTFLKRFGRV